MTPVPIAMGPVDAHGADLLQPGRLKEIRSQSAAGMSTPPFPPRMQSLAASTGMFAGSFGSDFRILRPELRQDFNTMASYGPEDDVRAQSEKRQAELRDEIDKETKIRNGSENMLEALNSKNAKAAKEQKRKVEDALNTSNRKLAELKMGLEAEIQRSKETYAAAESLPSIRAGADRPSTRQGFSKEPDQIEEETESPSFVFSEILEALDTEGKKPEYYVEYLNNLVELLKRHPSLKYDLAWDVFGLRMQTMLLSDSREVVAAGYRAVRYAITDRKSLQTIRALHTDFMVIKSLVKDSKASVEREQAMKFLRSFLDVKGGVQELSRMVVRMVVAVAGHSDDRLRNIAILTLGEILVRDPQRLVDAGGMGCLTDALGHNFRGAQGLTLAFLYLLDTPNRRKFLRSGHELEMPLATFGASPLSDAKDERTHESHLRASAKVLSTFLRSWPGLVALSMNNFAAIRSLVASLYIPMVSVRTVLLELFTDVLRIKPPSWSSSFLAGRRLTTYARVANLKAETVSADEPESEEESNQRNLVDHFIAVVLGALLHSGLLKALLNAEEEPLTFALKRKTSLLIGEVLKMSNELLPEAWSSKLQVLPELLKSSLEFGIEERFVALGTLYQIDSVNRTLYRSEPSLAAPNRVNSVAANIATRQTEQTRTQQGLQVDEAQFRNMMLESGVLNTVNFTKWRWDQINAIIEGPLRNPKRLDEAIKSTKWLHRILGFYRPFKYRFSDVKNTKPNQRYIRIGCNLMTALIQNPEGVKYLGDSKVIRQLAECLAHFDRLSGITTEQPMFSKGRLAETTVGGYFCLLGALSKDMNGLLILERWRIFNMFYHIVELRERDDLIKSLLSAMDYTLDSHLRIILAKAMSSCSKDIRIFATRLLRKYANMDLAKDNSGTSEWAIRILVTQLYDPEIEVCEVAIKILEEACRQKHSLEYIVKCRPALDHLGEIGAPLLLRFLSTSVGYTYLDELDYITKEMDDWFLGRNDTYVAVIESSLARALNDPVPDRPPQQMPLYQTLDDTSVTELIPDYGVVPPHFYRELTRTKEGCKLLAQTGHFDQFAATIEDYGLEEEDPEMILKVKGCLWAVANVGSMELGAPFLEKSDVVRSMVRIAECSEVMTVRGTAFFALGLISRSLHGQEILTEFGWDGTVNMRGESLGFCMPLEFGKLFDLKPWGSRPGFEELRAQKGLVAKSDDANPTIARVLKCVAMLGNTVLSKKGAGELNRIKARKPQLFQTAEVFHKVMGVLESHHFHYQMWCFAMNLFSKQVMRVIVLGEPEPDLKGKGRAEIQNDSGDESDREGPVIDDDDD